MKTRKKTALLIALAGAIVLFFCACSQKQAAGTSATDTSQASSAAGSVLSEILACAPEDISSFVYMDTPTLYLHNDGSFFPKDGAADITFSCGNYGAPYAETEAEYILKLAGALQEYALGETVEEISADIPLPTGRYFILWPSLSLEWNPILTFFDSGEVYIDYNGREEPARRWHAANPAQFDELKAVLEEIQAGLDDLPLDYQTESWLSLDRFHPQSKALRLNVENKGIDTITVDTFRIEQQIDGAWQLLGEASAADLTIAPRAYTRYAIDLTKILGAQQPGDYRLSGVLTANGKTLPLEHLYAIGEEFSEISNPLLPEMTPENQAYCERYVAIWGFYSPFQKDFDEQNYLTDFHPYHLYSTLAYTEQKRDEHDKLYGIDIPAEIVEGIIMRHFQFTAEQIRLQTGTSAANSSEYYNPDTSSYHFEGGYGGGSASAIVTESRKQGNLLTLRVDWYDMGDSFISSQELTLQVGDGDYDFVYVAGSAPNNAWPSLR